MDQRLRTHIALIEGLKLIPSTYDYGLQFPITSPPRDPKTFWPMRALAFFLKMFLSLAYRVSLFFSFNHCISSWQVV